ncbi:hypothetical protein ACF07Q_28670 [Nocardiopsis dassonvillei]|uniref:hypothetical protein n=1 Tax=Nocardiopsis dassonvillei TaxID=2014 RepID=UPI0036FEA7A1
MTTRHHPCNLCGRPSGDNAPCCTTCATKAATALRTVADWLAEDLVTATAKQVTLGTGQSGGKPTKASEAPMPIDLRASEAAAVLRSTLSTWVRLVHAAARPIAGPACRTCTHRTCRAARIAHLPADTAAAMAAWLAPVVTQLRAAPWGADLADEIIAAVDQALRAVDRPIRYVPLPTTCRMTTLDGDTPRACGGALRAVVAPGLPIDRQVRCSVSRDHTTTVEAEEKARRRAARVAARLART